MNNIRHYINLIENIQLNERIVNNTTAIVFHRTKSLNTVNEIGKEGFYTGDSGLYGGGIYTTYSFESQLNDYMRSQYGNYIIRSRVKLYGLLILDYKISKMVYGTRYSFKDQIEDLRIKSKMFDWGNKVEEFNEELETTNYSSNIAKILVDEAKLKNVKGIIYTGRSDGNCIVLYDRTFITPLAYTKEESTDDTKHEIDFTWTKILTKELVNNIKPDGMSDNERHELERNASIKQSMKMIRANPDSILQRKSPSEREIQLALSLKPSLVLSFEVYNTIKFLRIVFSKNHALIADFFASKIWNNASPLIKRKTMNELSTSFPQEVFTVVMKYHAENIKIFDNAYQILIPISIANFDCFKEIFSKNLLGFRNIDYWGKTLLEELSNNNKQKAFEYALFILNNRHDSSDEMFVHYCALYLGKELVKKLPLTDAERKSISE